MMGAVMDILSVVAVMCNAPEKQFVQTVLTQAYNQA